MFKSSFCMQLFNRFLLLFIVLAVGYAVGYETFIYWYQKTRPWQPSTSWGRMIFYYSFFTVLTNLLLAVSCLLLFFKPNYNSQFFRVIRLDALVGVIITMIVYNGVLRGIHRPPTLSLQITNELLHLIVPIIGLLSWLIYGPYPRIDKKTILLSLFPLMVYGIYIFVRGALTKQYPYPFINPLRVGYDKMLFNVMMILALFILLALLLAWIDRLRSVGWLKQ